VPKPSPGVYLKVPRACNYDIKEARRIIDKYSGEIGAIESYFRKLEERYRGKKRARQGEEIDIREYVQAELEYEATGIRPDKKMFKKRAPVKRKAAWAVLADISASTGFGFGYRIIDYIKDALLIQGEALGYSGYPFGIFAFHSGGSSLKEMINYKDTVYIIKDFKEEYTDQSRGRVMSLYPYGGTLMVNAIEYISDNLKKIEGSPKGLSIITDGEPDIPGEVKAILDRIQKDGIFPFLFVIGSEHERCAKSLIDNYVIIKKDRISELPNEVLRIFTTYGIIK
jgi:nitric oxide reductase activation protein